MEKPLPDKLWNRNFFLLWQGQLVSQLGSQGLAVAMVFWIKHATGSGSLMGTVMLLSMLPAALLGPLAGAVADQYSRRKIIILADIIPGVMVIAVAAVMWLAPERTGLILALLLPGALVLGVVRAFFFPAVRAAIPDIVPDGRIEAANSLYQSSAQLSILLGQGLGGYLFVLWGAPLLFLIDGVTYLFSAASESFVEIPQKLPETSPAWRDKAAELWRDMVVGFRFVWTNTGLRALVFAAAVLNFFLSPILVLLPFFVEDVLGVRADWYGYIVAGFGVGSLVGYVIAGVGKLAGRAKSFALIASVVLTSAGFAALSVVTEAGTALGMMMGLGVANGFFNVQVISLLQVATPSEVRGRVFGLLTAISGGLMPLGMWLGGITADLVDHDIPLIYSTCGLVSVVLSIAIALNRDFRDFLATKEPLANGGS